MSESFLDKAYGARDAEETRKLYDDWAASYEAELGENGYATPGRCAAALAKYIPDKTRPILDFGCGTGLSGLALRLTGFDPIDGVDVSSDMLAQARGKTVYRDLRQIRPGEALGHKPGEYAAIAAIGVIGAGAAPVSVFDSLMHGLAKGGLFVFSFNDHALEEPQYEARVMEWTDCGAARLLFAEHGDHIPGIGLKAKVYVLEKN
ncbi:class I SAM-dependent DNA methyltransferase [Sulfitobacter mediterraneus]|uniref:class I SAM-dependent DNA methyltransferase n=1 Tax=Sulfitobacter mediterraneus TaxID=83219 RepID=UPI000EA29452|nr:methyltransferase domain-containing protein [Sulfitobacter mediterraneus]